MEATAKHALTGIVVAWVLRLIFRYWYVFALIWLVSHFMWVADRGPERDAVLATFSRNQVKIVSLEPTYLMGDIRGLKLTLTNGAEARIYNVSLDCTFRSKANPENDPPYRTDDVSTAKRIGYVRPGETVSYEIKLDYKGMLLYADPKSFECTPVYFIEGADMYKVRDKTDLSLLSQVDTDFRYSFVPKEDKSRMLVDGVLTNKSKRRIMSVDVACMASDGSYPVEGNTRLHVGAHPGDKAPFNGIVAMNTAHMGSMMYSGMKYSFCRLTAVTPAEEISK